MISDKELPNNSTATVMVNANSMQVIAVAKHNPKTRATPELPLEILTKIISQLIPANIHSYPKPGDSGKRDEMALLWARCRRVSRQFKAATEAAFTHHLFLDHPAAHHIHLPYELLFAGKSFRVKGRFLIDFDRMSRDATGTGNGIRPDYRAVFKSEKNGVFSLYKNTRIPGATYYDENNQLYKHAVPESAVPVDMRGDRSRRGDEQYMYDSNDAAQSFHLRSFPSRISFASVADLRVDVGKGEVSFSLILAINEVFAQYMDGRR